jgi:dTDP-D-glucose 4,6-dehydratase
MAILVTGGAEFIGSDFVLGWSCDLESRSEKVIKSVYSIYASNFKGLKSPDTMA